MPDPVAWPEVPETIGSLARQRDRWHRGVFETLNRHRKMLLNPRCGTAGLPGFPFYYFLELPGPVIETIGYLYFCLSLVFGITSGIFLVAFTLVALILGSGVSIAAIVLQELSIRRYPNVFDLVRLFGYAVLQNFGYRQLTGVFRFGGIVSAIRRKSDWGRMEHKGFEQA